MPNFFKMIFFSTLLFGTFMAISSYSWVSTWMGLEINLISFIPLINKNRSVYSSEASMKYFLVQALASSSFLLSIITMLTMNEYTEMFWSMMMIMNLSILMKMGAAPLHFWVSQVMIKLNWNQNIILLTIQKVAPMIILMYTNNSMPMIMFMIISSILIGSILGINQTNMKSIMAYSSINHTGWMISCLLIMQNIWFVYFSVYCIISIAMMMIFKMMKISHLKQMYFSNNNKILFKFSLIINFLSLGGLPPFLGFLPKWIIIQNLIFNKLNLIALLMIVFTLITLFYYLRITFSILMMSYNKNKWFNKNSIKNKNLFLINMISSSSLILVTIMLNMI